MSYGQPLTKAGASLPTLIDGAAAAVGRLQSDTNWGHRHFTVRCPSTDSTGMRSDGADSGLVGYETCVMSLSTLSAKPGGNPEASPVSRR
jgi:hypothetical protein